MTVGTIDDETIWDSFVALSPQGTVFSTAAWLAAGARAQGGRPVRLGVWREGRLVAGLSFVEIEKGPFRKANTPVLSPHGGMLCAPGEEGADSYAEAAGLLISLLESRYHSAALVHSPTLGDMRPFSRPRWRGTVRSTFLLDITDPDALWRKFKDRARRKINKAEKTIELGCTLDATGVTDLFERVFTSRGKKPPLPRSIVAPMVGELMKAGLVEVAAARLPGGEPAAFQMLAHDARTVYTVMYGTAAEASETGADSLLIWDAAKRYSATHERLDLVGANIESIAFFKQGFGGVLIPYHVSEFYSSPFARTAMKAYTAARKMVR
jgi:hypothetical protein